MDIGIIKDKIAEDKARSASSYRRYPVRFLFMEMNNNTQNEIEDLVKSADGELLELSDYIMKKDDGWMTKNRFIQIIKNNTSATKDTYVLGFSELIRFFSRKEIESTVLSLFDIENTNIMDEKFAQRRIYFICFSMIDNISKVLQNSFARKSLIDPFINLDYELSGEYREVCFVSSEFSTYINKNKITTSVEWIGLWRHSEIIDFKLPIWCCSESLYEWHKKASPDNVFQIDVVRNAKDYIEKAYNVTIGIPYDKSDFDFWNRLFNDFTEAGTSKDMSAIVNYVLGVDANSMSALASKYLITKSPYERWLVKCYVEEYYQFSFLGKVFRLLQSESKKEFLSVIWQQGYIINDSVQLEERRAIINELNKYAKSDPPEKEIEEVICSGIVKELNIESNVIENLDGIHLVEICQETGRNLEDLKRCLKAYYTRIFKPAFIGQSNVEKEFVINLYSNGVLDKADIKSVYLNFFMYLFGQAEDYIVGKDEWKKYLQAYRESKVLNKDNSYLERYYDEGCASSTTFYRMYYGVKRQEILIAPYLDKSDIYIFDGVGAEYLPLMIELVKKNGYDIQFCDYAACHLPSITDVNKDYLSSIPYKEWFLDFDREVIHGEYYKTTTNLRKAFDILESKIEEIISGACGKRIVITADHGATARARWKDTKKKYDFAEANHEGRCCKVADKLEYEDTIDYITYEDEIKPGAPYVISLNEQSLYNKPRYEDHGGATIEEMLVPVIVAVPHNIEREVTYKVFGDKMEVSGLDKIVSFVIIPDPEEESYVIESDMTKHVLKKSGSVYSAKLISGKEQDITVIVAEKEYSFRTKSRAKKNMEGDDGFDD